jgi:hypothetical protein
MPAVAGRCETAGAPGGLTRRDRCPRRLGAHRVAVRLRPQMERLDGRVDVGALPTLQASRPGLFRVFQNLIANAFKFHAGDAPHVTVSARRRRARGQRNRPRHLPADRRGPRRAHLGGACARRRQHLSLHPPGATPKDRPLIQRTGLAGHRRDEQQWVAFPARRRSGAGYSTRSAGPTIGLVERSRCPSARRGHRETRRRDARARRPATRRPVTGRPGGPRPSTDRPGLA